MITAAEFFNVDHKNYSDAVLASIITVQEMNEKEGDWPYTIRDIVASHGAEAGTVIVEYWRNYGGELPEHQNWGVAHRYLVKLEAGRPWSIETLSTRERNAEIEAAS